MIVGRPWEKAVYHAIVRAIVLRIFRELNKGNYEPVLSGFAPSFEHWFVGESALSGRRTRLETTRAWYERLYRIFPNIRFHIRDIAISGWPWNTTAVVEWTDSYILLNGAESDNCGVHVIKLRWGKGVSVRIYCDTSRLHENLAVQLAGGAQDAGAPPLVDGAVRQRDKHSSR